MYQTANDSLFPLDLLNWFYTLYLLYLYRQRIKCAKIILIRARSKEVNAWIIIFLTCS